MLFSRNVLNLTREEETSQYNLVIKQVVCIRYIYCNLTVESNTFNSTVRLNITSNNNMTLRDCEIL